MNRALLQQALEALEQRCGTQAEERQPGGLIDRLRDAVDAPDVTPAWHDAPTCPGLWLCDEGDSDPYCFTTHRVTWPLNSMLLGDGERWYGPIPEDGK